MAPRSLRVAPCAALDGGRPDVAVLPNGGRVGLTRFVLACAWSRLFCGNSRIELPQAQGAGYRHANRAARRGPEISASGAALRLPQADGRRPYTARPSGSDVDLVPDHFSLFSLLPAVRPALEEACASRSAAAGSRNRWRRPRRWSLRRGFAVRGGAGARSRARRLRRRARTGPTAEAFPVLPPRGRWPKSWAA